jgi:predicted ester cyclase
MSIDTNKALVRRQIEMLDRKDLKGLIATCAPDAIFHGLVPGPLSVGEYRHRMARFLNAFPDARFLIGDMIAEGEKIACRFTIRGTHRVALRNSNKSTLRTTKVAMPVISIIHIVDNQVAEVWIYADLSGPTQLVRTAPAYELGRYVGGL